MSFRFYERPRDEHEAQMEKNMSETKNVTRTNRLHLMAGEYRKTATIKAVSLDFLFCVDSKEGQLLGNAGDYLVIAHDDSPEKPHRWIISKTDFEQTYERVLPHEIHKGENPIG